MRYWSRQRNKPTRRQMDFVNPNVLILRFPGAGFPARFPKLFLPDRVSSDTIVMWKWVSLQRRYPYLGVWALLLVGVGTQLRAQSSRGVSLPEGALVIERAAVPRSVHLDREMLLWMIAPEKHDRGELKSNVYSCPERTQGSFYRGPTRISLFDTASQKIINTISLKSGFGDADSFDIPYRILPDFYYIVPGHTDGSEGKPALLALRDINGDGLPLEVSFFEAEACMGLLTTTIGYSTKQDKLIQYEVELRSRTQKIVEGRGMVGTGDATTKTTAVWVDYLFAEKPSKLGFWSYKIDYTGRGGTQDTYNVHYDPARGKFFGTLNRLIPPWGVQ